MTVDILCALYILVWAAVSVGIYALSKRHSALSFALSALCCIASLAVCIVLFANADKELHTSCFSVNGVNSLLGCVASFMWSVSTLFSKAYFLRSGEPERLGVFYAFTVATLGATLGVFFASDLMTLWIFFEIMSLTSFVWVIREETREAVRAAGTYLTIAIIGGLAMFFGLALLNNEYGTIVISELKTVSGGKAFAAGILLLTGFGAKAGMFPLHIWLPKSHPVAPAPASALLSGILTKTGIYGAWLLTALFFSGNREWAYLLLAVGVVTMVLGAVLALVSTDIKRTLACSSMSQIGFITVGLAMASFSGAESGIAYSGVLLHMLNHSSLKLLLFLCAGAILMNAHTLDLNELRGFGRKKPFLAALFLLGSLGISGVPLFNGFVSKTLLHESITENAVSGGFIFTAVEWIFIISGALTFAYMTKLFVTIFLKKGIYERKTVYLTPLTTFSLGAAGVAVLALGLDGSLARKVASYALGVNCDVNFLSAEPLLSGALTVALGLTVCFAVIRPLLMKYGKHKYISPFDLEERIYRPLLTKILPDAFGAVSALFADNRVSAFLASRLFYLCSAAMKIACDALDLVVLALSKTVLSNVKARTEPEVGNRLTQTIGDAADELRALGDAIAGRERKKRNGAEAVVAKSEALADTTHRIIMNFSFALLMAGIGIVVILVVLIISVSGK